MAANQSIQCIKRCNKDESFALTSRNRRFAIKPTLYSQCDILVCTLATITIAISAPAKLLSNQRVTAVALQCDVKGIPL